MDKVLVANELLLAAKELLAVNDADFWKWVKYMNWQGNGFNYKVINRKMVERWSLKESNEYRVILGKHVNILRGKILSYVKSHRLRFNISDDGLSDLVYHIIGLGKDSYEAVLQNPEDGYRRGMSRGYVESFLYCFPLDVDYAELAVK